MDGSSPEEVCFGDKAAGSCFLGPDYQLGMRPILPNGNHPGRCGSVPDALCNMQIQWTYADTYIVVRDHPLHKKYCFYSPDGLECFNYDGSSLGFCSMRASSTQPLLSLGGFEGAIQIVDTERLLLLRELCVFSDMGGRNTVGGTVMIDM